MDSNQYRQFSNPCPACRNGELRVVLLAYDANKKLEGVLHCFHISNLQVQKCEACGEIFFDATSHSQIAQGLQDKIRLPNEITKEKSDS